MNYLENSRKLLKLYPKQNALTILNKKKDEAENGSLMATYVTSEENISDFVNKMVFQRILNIKSKQK